MRVNYFSEISLARYAQRFGDYYLRTIVSAWAIAIDHN